MSESPNDTMASYTFDTLSYAKELIAAGMPRQQAEVISQRQRTLIENELATKADIAGIQRDMKRMDVDLRRSIKKLETGLQRDVKASETRLTLRLGSVVVIALGAMTTLTKLL
ncbi:MAG: hypothetical protein VX332_01970 [Pseudomonadota bacterium]|nr:hypothetical protein [Pseudomonadota bacterium]